MKKKRKSILYFKKFVFKIRMAEFPKIIITAELIEKILDSNNENEFQKAINELPEFMRMSPEFLAKGVTLAQSNYKKSRKATKPFKHKVPKSTNNQRSVRAILTPMGNKR